MKLAYINVEITGIPHAESGRIQPAGIIEIDDKAVYRVALRSMLSPR